MSIALLYARPFCFFKYVPVWLQPADALIAHTVPGASCAAPPPGPTPAASRGETPEGPEPEWPCPHPGRTTAPHLRHHSRCIMLSGAANLYYILYDSFLVMHTMIIYSPWGKLRVFEWRCFAVQQFSATCRSHFVYLEVEAGIWKMYLMYVTGSYMVATAGWIEIPHFLNYSWTVWTANISNRRKPFSLSYKVKAD